MIAVGRTTLTLAYKNRQYKPALPVEQYCPLRIFNYCCYTPECVEHLDKLLALGVDMLFMWREGVKPTSFCVPKDERDQRKPLRLFSGLESLHSFKPKFNDEDSSQSDSAESGTDDDVDDPKSDSDKSDTDEADTHVDLEGGPPAKVRRT